MRLEVDAKLKQIIFQSIYDWCGSNRSQCVYAILRTMDLSASKASAIKDYIVQYVTTIMDKERLLEQKRQENERNLQEKRQEDNMIGIINSREKNAFGGGLTDNGSTSQGEGNTYGPGNQGDPNGQPGIKRYGPGGGTGNNMPYNLSGRQLRSMPKPAYPGNEGGIVVVEVTVDKLGKVSAARAGIFGSTSSDPDLLEAATKAARAAKFNVDDNAPAFQKGTITYHFVLQ
jgi:colicin import membrane protein